MEELYKKHRPKVLKNVVGQEAATKQLRKLLEKETLPHTILLTGPSGCGKTTIARILRTKLDCSDSDFMELNCADFRGIDTVREIRSRISLRPLRGKCRIWNIDECHKLTNDAQNALLKMLEDTPRHVYFILTTTEPDKIIKTIKTRSSIIKLDALSYKDIEFLVRKVAKAEDKEVSDEAIDQIVESCEGSARQALVLLHQVIDLDVDEQSNAVRKSDPNTQVYELCQKLMGWRSQWADIRKILLELEGEEPESIRLRVLGYMAKVLLDGKKGADRAYVVINYFRDNFYDSKKAGLVAACYECMNTRPKGK